MHNLAAYCKAHEFFICLCETAQIPPRSSSLDQFKDLDNFPKLFWAYLFLLILLLFFASILSPGGLCNTETKGKCDGKLATSILSPVWY